MFLYIFTDHILECINHFIIITHISSMAMINSKVDIRAFLCDNLS